MGRNGLSTPLIFREDSLFFLRRFLEKEEIENLKRFKWIAYTDRKDFVSVFLTLDEKLWESHWWGRGSAFKSLTACKESIKMFFEDTGADCVFGITPCKNIKALKMARILGYQPLEIRWADGGIPYLISRKEKQ